MPIIAELRPATFTDPGSQAALAAISAVHELVLIGARQVLPADGVARLRRTLAPRRMIVLLIDEQLSTTERALIEDLLGDGIIPVILTCDRVPPGLTSWLGPGEPHRPARRPAVHRPAIRRRTRLRDQ